MIPIMRIETEHMEIENKESESTLEGSVDEFQSSNYDYEYGYQQADEDEKPETTIDEESTSEDEIVRIPQESANEEDRSRIGAVFVTGFSPPQPSQFQTVDYTPSDSDDPEVVAYVVRSSEYGSNSSESSQGVLIAEKISFFDTLVTSRLMRSFIACSVIIISVSIVSAVMLLSKSDSDDDGKQQNAEDDAMNKRRSLFEGIVNEISNATALKNPTSPESQALNWILNEDELDLTNTDPFYAMQRYVVTLLYFSTGGVTWKDQIGFLNKNKNECNWNSDVLGNSDFLGQTQGVVCRDSFNKGATKLFLNGMDLVGTIPHEISSLTYLREIDLANNKNLQGKFPEEFGDLKNLINLTLSDTDISGTIPTDLDRLTKLKNCHLFGNERLSPNFELLCSIDSLQFLVVDCNNQSKACSCCTCH